jgi:hypothetical protein
MDNLVWWFGETNRAIDGRLRFEGKWRRSFLWEACPEHVDELDAGKRLLSTGSSQARVEGGELIGKPGGVLYASTGRRARTSLR